MKCGGFFVVCLCVLEIGMVSANSADDDKMILVSSDGDPAWVSLSLAGDLGIDYMPKRIRTDCSCVSPSLRASTNSEVILDFSVRWKGQLVVPVVFAFYDDEGEARDSRKVWLVRRFHGDDLKTDVQIR